MLDAVGAASVEELYRDVPESVLLQKPLDLPEGMSELAVRRAMEAIRTGCSARCCGARAPIGIISPPASNISRPKRNL